MMNKLYKNWFVHNVFGHSISELFYWALLPFNSLLAHRASVWFHDVTCPKKSDNRKYLRSYEGKTFYKK